MIDSRFICWHPVTMGDLLKERTDRVHSSEVLLSVTRERGVILQEESSKRDVSSKDKSKYKIVYPGDIVYNTMRMWQGVSGLSQFEGIVSPAYTVCKPTPLVEPRFIAHLLKFPMYVILFRKFSQGLVDDTLSLKYHMFAKIPTAVPSLCEQRYIADILDTVDTLIQNCEANITKLKMMYIGLLHDLLSRGIDAEGKLGDLTSHPEQFKEPERFIEYLGRMIPRDWQPKLLGQVLTGIDAGKSFECPDRPALADEWGILKVSAIRPEGLISVENKVITNPLRIVPQYEVRNGDVLMTRSNTSGLVGLACLVVNPPPRLLLSDKTLRLNPDLSQVIPLWIKIILSAPFVRKQIQINATGSSAGMKNISQGDIRSLKVIIPPPDEQKRIGDKLGDHEARILTEEAYCNKLKLVKEGIMMDLLTIKVRM